MDAVKTEELKRRQTAILEYFKISKTNGVDEKLKKKIKRYGRISSYTFIDKIFGGHLLSTIICDECKNCIQRVEPFLDLSLPIVDENKSFGSLAVSAAAFSTQKLKSFSQKAQLRCTMLVILTKIVQMTL